MTVQKDHNGICSRCISSDPTNAYVNSLREHYIKQHCFKDWLIVSETEYYAPSIDSYKVVAQEGLCGYYAGVGCDEMP